MGWWGTRKVCFNFGDKPLYSAYVNGQATEQFFYTDGLVLPWPGSWDGGIWMESLSWASACILLSCVEDIPDEFFDE